MEIGDLAILRVGGHDYVILVTNCLKLPWGAYVRGTILKRARGPLPDGTKVVGFARRRIHSLEEFP